MEVVAFRKIPENSGCNYEFYKDVNAFYKFGFRNYDMNAA